MREILYNLLHKCVTLGCGYFYSSASSKTSTYTLQIILHHPFPLLIYRQSHSYWERRKKYTFPQQLSSVCHEISAVCLWQLSSLSFQVTGVCYQVLFTGVLHVETNAYFCSEGSAKVEKPTMTGSVSSVLSIVICSMPVRLGPDRPIKPHYKLKWCLTGSLLCFQGNPPRHLWLVSRDGGRPASHPVCHWWSEQQPHHCWRSVAAGGEGEDRFTGCCSGDNGTFVLLSALWWCHMGSLEEASRPILLHRGVPPWSVQTSCQEQLGRVSWEHIHTRTHTNTICPELCKYFFRFFSQLCKCGNQDCLTSSPTFLMHVCTWNCRILQSFEAWRLPLLNNRLIKKMVAPN